MMFPYFRSQHELFFIITFIYILQQHFISYLQTKEK